MNIKRMSEGKQSTGSQVLETLKKFNPIVFLLAFGIMYFSNLILNSSLPLEQKILPYILSLSLFQITIFSEFYRIEKEKEFRERIFSG